MRKILITIAVLCCMIISQTTNANTQAGQLALEIRKGFLTIAGTGSINIGNITPQGTIEDRIINSNTTFQIQDQDGGCSGYYTTIQADSLSNGTSIINNNNIAIKIGSIITVAGINNTSLGIGSNIFNIRNSIKNPVTYIQRSSNNNCGVIGQYGGSGEIKISIPQNQQAGTYRGKIYYLLIDNN